MTMSQAFVDTRGGVLKVRPLIDTPAGPAPHERVPWTVMGTIKHWQDGWHWACGKRVGIAPDEQAAVRHALATLDLTPAQPQDTTPGLF